MCIRTVLCKSLEPVLTLICFPSTEPDVFVIFLKVVLSNNSPGFLKVFQTFFGDTGCCSLIFSPLFVSDHFQLNVFFSGRPKKQLSAADEQYLKAMSLKNEVKKMQH